MSVCYSLLPGRPMGRRAGHIRFALPFGVLTLALWTLALAGGARAQAAYQPEFEVDVVAARGDDGGPRVDVYTSIPHQNLRFLARTGGFEATYTVSVEVQRVDERGRQQGLVATRSWEREVRVPTYVATQADSLADEALQSLPLAPGRYLAEVQVEDGASRRTFVREVPLTVRPFDGAFTVSDPLILDRYDSRGRRLFPNVGAALRTDQESFTLFYEIYAQQAADLRVSYVVTETSRARERPSARALLGLPVREQAQRGAPFVLSERLSVRPGRNPATLRLDTDRFRVGDYTLSLRLETAGGDLIAEVERPFAMRWMGLEGQIRNMDEAIAQLRYVAREREIREMRAASDAEKLRLFRAFWDRRDPTPGTRRNERMEEYYYRVAYANERYGRFRDQGWNTDRGEVYIRFGEPDFVEQHPFNYGTKPYEIWYYNRHGRRFIFVDETGLGDFRLLVPIWDERTRM